MNLYFNNISIPIFANIAIQLTFTNHQKIPTSDRCQAKNALKELKHWTLRNSQQLKAGAPDTSWGFPHEKN
jgi:hypothetical protein